MLKPSLRSNVTPQTRAPSGSQKVPAYMIPFMKLPLILYRLGWMLGKRLMCQTHAGRKTGKVFHTALAVLHFNEQTREIFAVSPWSESNMSPYSCWINLEVADAKPSLA